MSHFLEITQSAYYHHFIIRMVATKATMFDAWSGAILRNNLLYSAEQVFIEQEQMSLREIINVFPLKKSHPLYKELQDGFPKGYQISMVSHSNLNSEDTKLSKGEIVTFSLYLIGKMSIYLPYFIQAIRKMCLRGLGKPQNPFLLIDICEQSIDNKSQIMATESTDQCSQLNFPVRVSDFVDYSPTEYKSAISIEYKTPVILYRPRTKKNTQLSYQDKCNGFPSFYQLVRSVAFRLSKIQAIHIDPDTESSLLFDENFMEYYLKNATNMILHSTNISRIDLKNTLKKESINKMPLSGYIGQQIYHGDFGQYLPILKFMEALGVGNETVYGMGKFEVEINK